MTQCNRSTCLTSALALVVLACSNTALAEDGNYLGVDHRGVEGAYVAHLDLNPLGIDRIEAMALILHRNGTVNFISEHEPGDLSTSGIGVWQRLGKKRIGIGLQVYRMGFEGLCPIIAVTTPDNCVLQIGATLKRELSGVLKGSMLLTIVGPENGAPPEGPAVVPLPPELPFVMKPMRIGNFRGATPQP